MTKLNNKMVKVGLAVVGSVAGLAVVIIGSKKMAKGAKTKIIDKMNRNNLDDYIENLEVEMEEKLVEDEDIVLTMDDVKFIQDLAKKEGSDIVNKEVADKIVAEAAKKKEEETEKENTEDDEFEDDDEDDIEDKITEEDIDKIVADLKDKCDTTEHLLKVVVKEMLLDIFNEKDWNGVLDTETIHLIEDCILMYIEYGLIDEDDDEALDDEDEEEEDKYL